MARLSTSLIWAVALCFIVLSVSPGNGDHLGNLKSLPLKRIICKVNDTVSLAVRNNTVVFATMNVWDESQLWFQDYYSVGQLAADDGCRKPFALVNVGTGLAIIPTEKFHTPMVLAQYNPRACVPLSMLWTTGAPVRDNFYMIKLFRNESRAFNALGGYVSEGTVLGWGNAGPIINDNILFKIVDFLSTRMDAGLVDDI